MAVQKSRVTRSKRGMRRSHDKVKKVQLAIHNISGETHLRHHITPDGFFHGRQVIVAKVKKNQALDDASNAAEA